MNITYIIGNGFDLGAGLNTSYRNFYDYLLAPSHSAPTKPHVKSIVDSIQDDRKRGYSDWKDFEEGLGHFAKHFRKRPYIRFKHKYSAPVDSRTAFRDCFAYVRDEIVTFMQTEHNKFNPNSLTANVVHQLSCIIDKFASETSGHRSSLERVLSSKLNEDWHIQTISLNYTKVFDSFLEKYAATKPSHPTASRKLTINRQVLHLHGVYPEAIFGVGDDTQIDNLDFRSTDSIRRLLIKPEVVEAGGRNWYEDALERIDLSTFVCIYGLSLGKTDIELWQHIAKWLFNNDEHQLIVFWYDKEFASQGIAFQNTKAVEVEDLFMGYVYDLVRNLSLSKYLPKRIEAIRDQIHVKVHSYTFR